MKHREATPRDIKDFERIAAEPKTSEVMESLGQQLCTNFERPSRVFLEIAANKLGLPYDLDRCVSWMVPVRPRHPVDPKHHCPTCHGTGGPPLLQSPAGA